MSGLETKQRANGVNDSFCGKSRGMACRCAWLGVEGRPAGFWWSRQAHQKEIEKDEGMAWSGWSLLAASRSCQFPFFFCDVRKRRFARVVRGTSAWSEEAAW